MHRIVVYLIKAIKMHTRINFAIERMKQRVENRLENKKERKKNDDGNMIIIGIFIECEDRKNHEKSTKPDQFIYM